MSATDTPDYTRPEVTDAEKDLSLLHDLTAPSVTRRMHEQSTKYIRKIGQEDDAVYLVRRQCETVFEGTARVLAASTGMMFAKEPHVEWQSSETVLSPQWDNIDGQEIGHLARAIAEDAGRDRHERHRAVLVLLAPLGLPRRDAHRGAVKKDDATEL